VDELVQDFLVESHEGLDQLDRDLVLLEQHPGSRDLLARVFRTVHSLKGASGLLGFARLEALAHSAEGMLADLRDGRTAMTPAVADVLLHTVDLVRELLATIEAGGAEGEVEIATTSARIESLRDVDPHHRPHHRPDPDPVPSERPSLQVTSVRVDLEVLDGLRELTDQLLLARDDLTRLVQAHPSAELTCVARRLDLVANALEGRVRRARTQPIGHLWSRLPRLAGDLGAQAGKSVRTTMEGPDTELDRAVLEAVKDPFTHLVRNAVDHGLETPCERVAAGKPPAGTVSLRARRDQGHVILEVCDDGAGIDPDRVSDVAWSAGVRTAAQLAAMSRAEVLRLVLLPGFSTAASVTRVSGRGVGMDVVRQNVEALGGVVEIDSHVGRGTTFRLRIPA
jgi:two-component system chemotaxis sensor kinase CheA